MKHIFALVAPLFVACCARPPTPSRPADTLEVRAWRKFELTLHVDEGFTPEGRRQIELAAAKWREVSNGRVRLDVVFDLDFESLENLRRHRDARHAQVVGLMSWMPLAEAIDAHFARQGIRPLAATTGESPPAVFLILDRIEAEHFLSVVMHEFGHVAGLDDLPLLGSVMSYAEVPGQPVPVEFTEADRALCKAARLCP